VLYIERDDFKEDPPKKYFRLAPDREVRLRAGYIIKCVGVIKNEAGEVIELRCTYDPETRSTTPLVKGEGGGGEGRRVKATIHWVSAAHARDAEVRLYDRLFTTERPGENGADVIAELNPASLEVVTGCKVEPSLAGATPETRYQFERLGYFVVDCDSDADRLVFNRTVTLRDQWAKIEKKLGA
jgi:glutaminyl-tRNA synthetase